MHWGLKQGHDRLSPGILFGYGSSTTTCIAMQEETESMAPRGRRRGHVLHRIRPWKHSLVVVAVNRMRHSAFAYAINRLAAKQRICVFMDIRATPAGFLFG